MVGPFRRRTRGDEVAEHADVQRFGAAIATKTDPSGEDVFSDDVVWHGAGASGEVRGKDEVVRQWRDPGGPAVAVKEIYADGVHTVAWLLRGDDGRQLEQAVVFHMDDGGKVSEVWSLPTDAEIAAALANGGRVPYHRNLPVFRTAEETRGRNTFEPEDIANISAFLREDVRWISPWGQGPSSREECIAQFKQFKAATGDT